MRPNTPSYTNLKYALCIYVKEYLLTAMRVRKEGRNGQTPHHLDTDGLSLVEQLEPLELDQFVHLAVTKMCQKHTFPLFCIETLNSATETLIHRLAETCLLDDFTRAGASQEMLMSLFGLRKVEVSTLRNRLKLNLPSGRPKAPTPAEIETVKAEWEACPDVLDCRLRLYATSIEANLPLHRVWHILQSHLRQI